MSSPQPDGIGDADRTSRGLSPPVGMEYGKLLSPYLRHNLRLNPFGACAPHELAVLLVPEIDIEALAAFAASPGRAVVIAGPPGCGKTSHLYAIHARFDGAGLWRLREDAAIRPRGPVVFVDEAQRMLSPWSADASWVVTVTGGVSRAMRRAGLEVWEVELCGLDEPGLRRFVASRLAWARAAAGPLPRVPDAFLSRLHLKHGADLRAIQHALYDWLQAVVHDEVHRRIA